MIKTIATLGATFIFSTALAQHATVKQSDARPIKYHHGRVVSTAAHQTYARTEKGKFISLIARLKGEKSRTKEQATVQAKSLSRPTPIKPKVKAVTIKRPSHPIQSRRRVVLHNKAVPQREVRVHRITPVRRQVGHSRFTQIGRG